MSIARFTCRALNIMKPIAVRSCTNVVGTKPYFEDLIGKDKVVVFIKGTREAPRCGFSNAVVQVLNMHDVDFTCYNVLADDKIREGIKGFTNWPTIPQIFINKEFIGGCDILLQMHHSGELASELLKVGIRSGYHPNESDGVNG